jgi:hypothetical protein
MASEPPAEQSFERYYRGLILGSARHSVTFEWELQRALGHRLRARRAERRARELGGIFGEAEPAAASAALLGAGRAVALAWLVSVGALLGAAASFGIRSWPSGLADLVLIALSFGWFLLDSSRGRDEQPEPVAHAERAGDEPST